jgi:hypothetical protein
MTEDELEALQGAMHAFTLTMNSVISALPPKMAREVRVSLQASLQVEQELDRTRTTPEARRSARQEFGELYLQLLQVRASQG